MSLIGLYNQKEISEPRWQKALTSEIGEPGFFGYRFGRVALVGRSNVGKSSLINLILKQTRTLIEQKAHVSSTPGKTRSIFFYPVTTLKTILVDLPGYGFAERSVDEKKAWAGLVEGYLRSDHGLSRVLWLGDSRVWPTSLDKVACGFLSSLGCPVTLVLTKTDTLKSQSLRAKRKKEIQSALLELGLSGANTIWVSAQPKSLSGVNELLEEIKQEGVLIK